MRGRALSGGFVFGLAGLLIAGGGAGAQTVLRVGAAGDLRNLDPMMSTDNATTAHGYMIFDQLFALDARLQPQLQMLAHHDASDDQRTHMLVLRPGQTWHDGSPVTAEDCVASIRRWAAKDPEGRALLANTASLATTDALTLRWEFREPTGAIPAALGKIAAYAAFMMPARLAATPPDKAIGEAVGSGPFRFVADAWRPAASWRYVRNTAYAARAEPSDGYAGSRAARVGEVQFTYTPDPTTKVSALQKGELDLVEDIQTDLALALASHPDVVARPRSPVGSTVLMRFNQLFPPFSDPRVRQAVQLATSQEDFMAAFAGDAQFWATCASMFNCATPNGVPAASLAGARRPDQERARALLREAGYTGAPVIILHPGDHAMGPLALVAADTMKRIGLNVTVQTVDYSTMMQRRGSRNAPGEGGWSVFFTRWEGTLQNPTVFLPIGAGCERAWFGWPCDQEIERLRTAWAAAADPAQRQQIVQALVDRAAEQVPFVNLGEVKTPSAWRRSLAGVPTTPTMIYWTIAKP